MKLPTKEELKQDFLASSETLHEWALRRIQEAVRLAEEEARREALDKAMSILRARSMLSSMHKTDCDAIRYSLQEIEALKAAPATAEAGKGVRAPIQETTSGGYVPLPAQPPSKAVTEETTPMRAGLRGSCPHGYEANVLKCGLCDDEWVERVREIAQCEARSFFNMAIEAGTFSGHERRIEALESAVSADRRGRKGKR